MSARLRVVGWRVQPILMTDDGEDLTPLNVQPVEVPARDWQAFKDGGDEAALAQVREQVEGGQPAQEQHA